MHSGPEKSRHSFDAGVSEKDLFETYLLAFEACVKEARVEVVMGAYNAVWGVPCCANQRLLCNIFRGEWGFEGHVVSDCGALQDFHMRHNYTSSPAESAAAAVKAGCDLNCGHIFGYLLSAVHEGLVSEADIDPACCACLKPG